MEQLFKESKEFRILLNKSTNLLLGKHTSNNKGDGIEFLDLREYVPGDDIRKIDWNVTARQNEPYVKEFTEEKDANHYICFDISASCQNKIEQMKLLATSLLLSSHKNNDAMCVIFFSKNKFFSTNLLKGKKQLMRCVYEISKVKPIGEGNLNHILKFLLNTISKKAIISFICDEMEMEKENLELLSCLRKKHQLFYFQIYNSTEKEIVEGLEAYEDIETGEELVFDLSENEIEEFHQEYDFSLNEFKKKLEKTQIKVFPLDCKDDICLKLKKNNKVLK